MGAVTPPDLAGRVLYEPAGAPRYLKRPLRAVAPPGPPLQGQRGVVSTDAPSGASPLDLRAAPEVRPPGELKPLFEALLAGTPVEVTPKEVRTLQAMALDTAQRLFDDRYGTDKELKQALGERQAHYKDVSRSQRFAAGVLGDRSVGEQQLACLGFLLRTFMRLTPEDSALRRAVIGKLAEMGRAADVWAILPHVRHGDASDLFHGLAAIRAITKQHGVPVRRGGLEHDPVIGPILKKDVLTAPERQKVIEAVLLRGNVVKWKRHKGENRNEVHFVTFAETLPGKDGKREPIEGVFKPERTWFGKDRAFFSREVAAYEFDKRLSGTGLVPPTVEVLLERPGEPGAEVGSMQYKIPRARTLGKNAHEIDPAFEQLVKGARYKRQEKRLRTLLFLLSDPDKLPNDVHKTPNYMNLVLDDDERLWMIDNSFNLGVPPREMGPGILPRQPDADLIERMVQVREDEVLEELKRHIAKHDARAAAKRFVIVTTEGLEAEPLPPARKDP